MTPTSTAPRALLWITGAALVLGAWACEEASKPGTTSTAAGSGGGSTASVAATSGAGGGGIFVPPDAGSSGNGGPCTADAAPDGPDPPALPCDPTSDAAACDLPPSVCADTQLLIYYTNPQCVNGFCQWDKKAHCCVLYCENGGCHGNLTK